MWQHLGAIARGWLDQDGRVVRRQSRCSARASALLPIPSRAVTQDEVEQICQRHVQAQQALFDAVRRAMDDGLLTSRNRDEVRDAIDEAEKAFHAWAAADFTSVRLPRLT